MLAVLFQKILNHLSLLNITVDLNQKGNLTWRGSPVSGFFDQNNNMLGVDLTNEHWPLVLFHEYCHVLQAQESKWATPEELKMFDDREDWSNGKLQLEREDLLRMTRVVQACELDCEKRVVELIKEYKIECNIEEYIRDSNAYVLTYEAERLLKKAAPIGSSEKTAHLMPNTFITDLGSLPSGFIDIIEELIEEENDSRKEDSLGAEDNSIS